MLGAVTGCAAPLSTLDPAGPRASILANLWWIMFVGAMALFALLMVLLYASHRWQTAMQKLSPGQWIVAGGLLLPLPVLVALTVSALLIGEQFLARPADGSEPTRVIAAAERWQWTFSYPDVPGAATTDNLLHIPAGVPVLVEVVGRDVIHSFWIPRLGGKMDAIPGHTNTTLIEADEPGRYYGVCAEYCGVGHETMRFIVEAHPVDEFAAALGGEEQ
ncbi:QoxB, Quinol oxidase subunit II [Devosia pacifica]|uniref:Cytochrome aa3 subunit 2 n=1 Tax=Devosia pacifica TaxID=1335967 RepID=A0A918SCD9_9HYPH|nr:cytochrome c oxidase subunit II [Devosia pacifica]GHA34652.1 QoxB, Quinol oxidase subunit II [Devosia pacifica]